MAQLSYYRPDPAERVPLPRSLLACAAQVLCLGVFYCWQVGKGAARFLQLRHFRHLWIYSIVECKPQWGGAFLVIGVGIVRSRRWSRAALLGLVPAYFMANIGQAIVDFWLNQGFLSLRGVFPADAARGLSLALAIVPFIWFCFPQVGGDFAAGNAIRSPSEELPLPIASWAVGCICLGAANLLEQATRYLMYRLGLTPANFWAPVELTFPLALATGGLLTLCRRRYGVAVGILCLISTPTMAIAASFLMGVANTPRTGGGAIAVHMNTALQAVQNSLSLAAAIFGLYAARDLKRSRTGGRISPKERTRASSRTP
jgi:hypothetical protein